MPQSKAWPVFSNFFGHLNPKPKLHEVMKKFLVLTLAGVLPILSQAQTYLTESFDYPDGALTNVSSLWSWHSGSGGAANTLNVVGGRAFINQDDAASGHDDYNRLLTTSFDPLTDNTTTLFAAFTVNFAALPFNGGTSVNGSYFAHFKTSSGSEFYSRIGATTTGAAPGLFRIGIGNEAGTPVFLPTDLSLNTTYLVVARLDLGTDNSTLWINPLSLGDPSVTATDTIGYAGLINSFALRQGTTGTSPNIGAPGDIYLDDLRVGGSFASVIPEPSAFALLALGLGTWIVRRRR